MPRVRILNEFSDTPNRQFPVGTAIQLTCQGEVGNDASKVSIYTYRCIIRKVTTLLYQSPNYDPFKVYESQGHLYSIVQLLSVRQPWFQIYNLHKFYQ